MKKVLALLLMSIVGFSVYGSKKSSAACCEKKDIICVNECGDCCIDECCCYKFFTCLNFDQIVVEGSGGLTIRREEDRPGTGEDEVHGTFELCFNKAFTKAFYKLTVFNVNKGRHNINENLLGAALYTANASLSIGKIDGMPGNGRNPIVYLCGFESQGTVDDNNGDPECGSITCDWCCCGTLTNKDLDPSVAANLRVLFQTIFLDSNVAVIVNGSDTCLSGKPRYGIDSGGLIRGQLSKLSLVKNCIVEC